MRKFGKFFKFLTVTKSKKRWTAATIVALICIIVLLCLIPCFKNIRIVTNVGSRTERSGNIYGEPLVQRFVPSGVHIKYIQIRFADCDSGVGSVLFTVEDKKGNVLFSQTVPVSELSDADYYTFNVNLDVRQKKSYYFKVVAQDCKSWQAPKLWISNNVIDDVRDVQYLGQDPTVRMQTNTEIGYTQFHYAAFFVSLLCIIVSACTALLVVHLTDKTKKRAFFTILFLMPAVIFLLVEALNGNSITTKSIPVYILNYILYLIIYLLFFVITNKLRFAVLFSNALIYILAVANYIKLEFRGDPVTLNDIATLKTAMNVAGEYQFKLKYMIILSGCLFMLITAVVSRFRYSFVHKRTRLLVGLLTLSSAALLVTALFNTDRYTASADSFMKRLGIVNNVWNQPKNFTDNGVIVAITMNAQYLTVDPPEVYSIDNLNNIRNDVEETAGTSMISGKAFSEYLRTKKVSTDDMPNIICIMDESYSDFSQFGDIELSQDYSPFMDSMTTNTIQGDLYVSTYGGGTANSEFEFLTGNSMQGMPSGSIPYQQYIDNDTGSMARLLKNMGYDTIALHPYLASGWNRPAVYNYMAFDQFLSVDDFDDPEYIRSYISDECSFEKIISLYEDHQASDPQSPLFLFNVTMQNHGSYTKNYVNFEPDIQYEGDPGKYPEAEQYFSVAHNTDAAVEMLVNYFSDCGEPTVICFFGDHLPSLKDGFYEMLMGVDDISQLDSEQMQQLYMTDFFVWANYSFVTPDIDRISLNYLSTLVMQVAGLPLSDYQLFLTDMYQQYPILTTMGLRDAEGNYIGSSSSLEGTDMWNYYSVMEYNNVFGDDNRDVYIFDYPYADVYRMEQTQLEPIDTIQPEDVIPTATPTVSSDDESLGETESGQPAN